MLPAFYYLCQAFVIFTTRDTQVYCPLLLQIHNFKISIPVARLTRNAMVLLTLSITFYARCPFQALRAPQNQFFRWRRSCNFFDVPNTVEWSGNENLNLLLLLWDLATKSLEFITISVNKLANRTLNCFLNRASVFGWSKNKIFSTFYRLVQKQVWLFL